MSDAERRKEFSIRQNWRGQIVLRVKDYERYAYSGEWMDARPKDLPEFWRRLVAGTQKARE